MSMSGQSDGEVSITANGQSLTGWTTVSISGGLDMAPAVFDLSATERTPQGTPDIVISPGDACTITIGGTLVLTGYVNRYVARVARGQHTVAIAGRSKCQDLVDCSAMPKGMAINNRPIDQIAKELVAPFAGPINVLTPDGGGSGTPYFLGVSLGQTPWEIISEIATYEGLLVHDDAKGDLVICEVGKTSMASGFTEGVNCQMFEATRADDMLYSVYKPVLMAQDSLAQIGPGANNAGDPIMDAAVKRNRPMIVISDQMVQGQFLAQQRAAWEMTRRHGRSQSVTLTCDSWRDSAGTLWTHNMLAPLDLPTVRVAKKTWLIAAWTFNRDPRSGTTAQITLMPPTAFSVQPTALLQDSAAAQVARTYQQNALGPTPQPASTAPTAPNAAPPTAANGYDPLSAAPPTAANGYDPF